MCQTLPFHTSESPISTASSSCRALWSVSHFLPFILGISPISRACTKKSIFPPKRIQTLCPSSPWVSSLDIGGTSGSPIQSHPTPRPALLPAVAQYRVLWLFQSAPYFANDCENNYSVLQSLFFLLLPFWFPHDKGQAHGCHRRQYGIQRVALHNVSALILSEFKH